MNEFIIIDLKLEVAKEFRQWLAVQGTKLIRVSILCRGGETDAAVAVIQTMEEYKFQGYHFCTVAIGCAQSAAFDVLIAGDSRYAPPGTRLMTHQASWQVNGSSSELSIGSEELARLNEDFAERMASRSKLSKKQILDKTRTNGGDWFMRPPEALKLGFIDYIGYPDFDIKMGVLK